MRVKNQKPMRPKTRRTLTYIFYVLHFVVFGIMLVMSSVTDSVPVILFWWGLAACTVYLAYFWRGRDPDCMPSLIVRITAWILPAMLVYLLARH